MSVNIHRNRVNAIAYGVLCERAEMSLDGWKGYCGEIAGLPAEIRINGAYLAFAYLMEREHVASKGSGTLTAPGQVLEDLLAIAQRVKSDKGGGREGGEAIDRTGRDFLLRQVSDLSDMGEFRTYMREIETFFEAVDAQKRIAQQFRILATLNAETLEQTDG